MHSYNGVIEEILLALKNYKAYKDAFIVLEETLKNYSKEYGLKIDMDKCEVTDWGRLTK